MSPRDEEQRFTAPPRVARWLLRVCCPPSRIEEMEGDLHEIYERTCARSGSTRAGLRYVFDVLDVCLRQGFARIVARTSSESWRRGALRVYPQRIRAVLVLAAALLVAIHAQWTGLAPTILFVIDGIIELVVLVAALLSLCKHVFSSARASREVSKSERS